MDFTGLLVGALLLAVGLVVGLLAGRSMAGPGGAGNPVADVAALLTPAADALLRVEQRLQEVERDRVGAYAGAARAGRRTAPHVDRPGQPDQVAGRCAALAAGARPLG